MAYMHIGKDFVPPDVPGKVTGRIKYAGLYREGMRFTPDCSPVRFRTPECSISTLPRRWQWTVCSAF